MDQIVEKARKRLAALNAEKERLEAFLDVLSELSGASDSAVTVEEPNESADDQSSSEQVAVPRGQGSSPKMIVREAKKIILEHNRPLTRSQLVEALESQGLQIGGKDKSKNMGTILWRSKQFDNLDGYGYWPKDARKWDDFLQRDVRDTF